MSVHIVDAAGRSPVTKQAARSQIGFSDRLLGLILCTGLLLGSISCTSFDHLTDVTEDHFPEAAKCGKCHIAIYNEWSGSDHARAYTNVHFKSSTDSYAFEACLSCHTPNPIVSSFPPETRNIHQEDGVTCVSCHFDKGVLSGPLPTTGKVQPHPVGVSPEFYQSSRLCGRCHEGTFQQWQASSMENKPTCQVCHMPAVTRKVTQSAGGISGIIVAFEQNVPQRQHVFQIYAPDSGHDMVSVQAIRAGSTVELSIHNNLPHLLPTGDFGYRVLDLTVSGIDPQGHSVQIFQKELTKELKTAIAANDTLTRVVQVPISISRLRFQLQRRSYSDHPVLDLFEKELDLK
ncbi:MAG: hypothetical protein HQ515_26355 [Phycisphaeraceae bacterium]|nr:hypothetical protein [Phycisphaeraceae bacterium]